MRYKVVEDLNYSNTETGVVSDKRIRYTAYKTSKQYPEDLRGVVYHDEERQRYLVVYTNNLSVSAEVVALLYNYRWMNRTLLQMDQAASSCERVLRLQ